jgi:hypothetical protein
MTRKLDEAELQRYSTLIENLAVAADKAIGSADGGILLSGEHGLVSTNILLMLASEVGIAMTREAACFLLAYLHKSTVFRSDGTWLVISPMAVATIFMFTKAMQEIIDSHECSEEAIYHVGKINEGVNQFFIDIVGEEKAKEMSEIELDPLACIFVATQVTINCVEEDAKAEKE